MADIFISYSRKDKALVRQLHDKLKSSGREVWVDFEDIPPSAEWLEEVYAGIDAADSFVFVISPDSIASEQCGKEISRAIENNKRLLPVLGRDVDPKTVPTVWARLNWIWCRQDDDFETAFQTLIKAMDTDLGWVHAHTRLLVRATEWDGKGRDPSLLLRGRDLSEAERWAAEAADKEPRLTPLQTQYLLASHRETRRRQRITLAAVASALVITIALFLVAVYQRNEAIRQRQEALRRRFVSIGQALAAYAPREQTNFERAALLARQAYLFNERYGGERSRDIDKALRDVLSAPHPSVVLNAGDGKPQFTSVAFSRNGQLLAVADKGQQLHVWNVQKRGLPLLLRDSGGLLWCLAFSPTEDLLAAGADDGRVVLWRLGDSGQFGDAQVLSGAGRERVTSLAFSADGSRLAAGNADGRVRVWNLREAGSSPVVLCCHSDESPVWAVAFHPLSNTTVVSGGGDQSLRLWDTRKSEGASRLLGTFENEVTAIAYSPNGSTIAVGTQRSPKVPSLREMLLSGAEEPEVRLVGGKVWLLDTRQGEAGKRSLGIHEGSVSSLAITRNGEFLASAGDKSVFLWRLQKPGQPEVLQGHQDLVSGVAFSSDGQLLASVSADSSIRLWSVGQPPGAPVVIAEKDSAVRSLAFSRNSALLAWAAGEDGLVRVWDMTNMTAGPTLTHGEATVTAVAFGDEANVLASGSEANALASGSENTVRVWNLDKPQSPFLRLPPHKSSVESLAFSPNGKLLASAGTLDREIRLSDLGRLEATRTIQVSSEHISALAFCPSGKSLAWGGDDGVHLWEYLQAGSISTPVGNHKSAVNAVAFGANDEILLSGDNEGKVHVWKLGKDATQSWPLNAHDGAVRALAVDSTRTIAASAGRDGKVKIWDLNRPSADPQIFSSPGDDLYALALSGDDRWLAAGGSNKTVMIWPRTRLLAEMVCRSAWRNLTEKEWRDFIAADVPYECTCPELPPPPGVSSCPAASPLTGKPIVGSQ